MRVLFYKGKVGLFGSLIRLKTGSAYSHAELLFDDGWRFGIDAENPARFYADVPEWDPAVWDAIYIPESGVQEICRRFCESVKGAKYDWKGVVFSQTLPWGWADSDKYFCSELCVEALQAGHYSEVSGAKPYRIAPHKLANILLAAGGKYVQPRF